MMMLHAPSADHDQPAVIVVGAANGRDAARRAIAVVGGRSVACLDWDEAPPAIARHPGRAVVMIEAESAGDDVLDAALPRIDAAARALDLPVIVALDAGSIDIVAATMLTASAQLLCAPSMSDRVVALAIAAESLGIGSLADTVREGEAVRLQRLNEEVARIAEVLSRLTRRGPDERPAAAIAEHPSPFRPQQPDDIVIDAAEVRRAIRARRMRDQHFGGGLFEDPAWDILLDLFAAELERSQVSVSSLCIAASVAPTTALRWISKLTEAGLLERHPDPFDRRRAFMELSPPAARAMRDHVGTLRRAGLPFG